ncbi:SDR family oxidoreductase [Agrobacterium rubi]|uniref:SDR family oxidoreductase n=1 Tax=Agrobacterium rubi TaxID=28099 RepID=A0AAE7RB68_9HYPH|nr:SDR family oxidoreductase [Agrobacterium rubi]NTF03325.1 SDR family oxidoreductase [Agrobacterium rubi]NTF09757.1 SDR family oxidoreductase [Agrobacterium rubi]NTF22066.1 SDR family oxidoreductase [Agrobacterium rubi]NTF28923.1 SDR family oxidoreductase [Agrobacterium rubi]
MAETIAVVTGGAGDIGRAIAAKLTETHDRIVLVDIDGPAVERVVASLGGSSFTAMACDVTDAASLAELSKTIGALGIVRTLVNNAGAARAVSLHDTTPEIWRQDNALNLEAPFLCFRAFEDALKQSQGSLINIASVNGMSVFGHPAYSAAKAGLIHLTKLIAVEYGKFGIRANAVAPGTVRTRAWEARAEVNPQVFEEAKHWYPLRRIVAPDDVANAVGFLASDQAAAISGVCLPVDCGLTAGQAPIAHTFSQSDHY